MNGYFHVTKDRKYQYSYFKRRNEDQNTEDSTVNLLVSSKPNQ